MPQESLEICLYNLIQQSIKCFEGCINVITISIWCLLVPIIYLLYKITI